jgi:hypothetical protein
LAASPNNEQEQDGVVSACSVRSSKAFFAILEDKLSGAGQFGLEYLSEKSRILDPLA